MFFVFRSTGYTSVFSNSNSMNTCHSILLAHCPRPHVLASLDIRRQSEDGRRPSPVLATFKTPQLMMSVTWLTLQDTRKVIDHLIFFQKVKLKCVRFLPS